MSEFRLEDVGKVATGPAQEEEAEARAARREELRQRWLEKRAVQEAEAADRAEQQSVVEKVLDWALTPTYVAVGGAIIIVRKLRGEPSVTMEDYED